MRGIDFNGYIDEELWLGDEVTPEILHEALYGADGSATDDVRINMNSYGGSCNAAVRMYDDIRAYPGRVTVVVSGTAASAATVVASAADHLEMTPGSLWMIHNPLVMAFGNEGDLMDAINLLRASKESILNVYAKRCKKQRCEVSDMMTASTWMDSQTALDNGFIDAITDYPMKMPMNAATGPASRDMSHEQELVDAWRKRYDVAAIGDRIKNSPKSAAEKQKDPKKPTEDAEEPFGSDIENRVSEEQTVDYSTDSEPVNTALEPDSGRVSVKDTDRLLENIRY